jgi:hypothetical protein
MFHVEQSAKTRESPRKNSRAFAQSACISKSATPLHFDWIADLLRRWEGEIM